MLYFGNNLTMLTIGIDEAGRGALAGPVCVGVVVMPADFAWEEVFARITRRGEPKLRDSKKLSPQQRDTLYEYIIAHNALRYASAMVDAQAIDTIGIANAARQAVATALGTIGVAPGSARVLLDAGLSAPRAWEQESFVKGDERIPVIALASIIAKVTRDRGMEMLAKDYPEYGFDQHKGYGTAAHYAALRTHGISAIHRKSFVHL